MGVVEAAVLVQELDFSTGPAHQRQRPRAGWLPMSDSGKESVAKWLRSQGYPLEMSVARAFRQAGFRVTQGRYYEDPQSHEWREIDVAASWAITRAGDTDVSRIAVTVAAECKLSRDKPWVLFCHESRGT